jgi:hypothetical protein
VARWSYGSIRRGGITPRRTPTKDPKDAVEHAPVIHARNAARLVRQHRLDRGPFIIGEFVAHDSRHQFVGLNQEQGDRINLQNPDAVNPRRWSDFTTALGDTADTAGPAAGLVPVENDPDPTYYHAANELARAVDLASCCCLIT